MGHFRDGDRVHLVDKKGRQYAFTLKAGETFQYSGQRLAHDALIGQTDGTLVTLSGGKQMLALLPTLAEYVLKMPRGAQVIYPKDLATIVIWADIHPGARVLEAGTGSGALTMALLRAVGQKGMVVSYEVREDFARTAAKNIQQYMGTFSNLTLRRRDVTEGLESSDGEKAFDRVVLDLPEPWRVVPLAADVLRAGGLYLSYVPTIPQVMQTVEALERASVFGLLTTFETLLRGWNIEGRSVRPDHRMVAHSGFITVARKVAPGWHRPVAAKAGLGDPEGEVMNEQSAELTEEDDASAWGA
jgi:tRNA (adenine57-N1/adenine58-N1)-methyltransferase